MNNPLQTLRRSFAPEPVPQTSPGTAPTPILELREIVLEFGEQRILHGVNIAAQPRERLVIMGQSGGRKSTLLRLILGILKPTSGSVQFKGIEVTRMGRRRLNKMRQKIGMVYQYSALISSLSVRDNLALPLEELTDKPVKEVDELVDQKLAMVGMADVRDKMPSELSGGMRKRIGLARALMLDPEVILYDEPSAGLDPVISSVIDELIIEMSEKIQTTSIIVTHEMESAFRIGTRMAMLFEGRILAEDTPEGFRDHHNEVIAQFISGSTEGPILESKS